MLGWLRKLFAHPVKRVELRLVSQEDAQDLLQYGWRVAPENKTNDRSDLVYVEYREHFTPAGK
jgi:hypothetical protein